MIIRSSPGVFRWGQVFQRGDLPIFITDNAGNPLDPHKITYNLLYQPRRHHNLCSAPPSHHSGHFPGHHSGFPNHAVVAGPCHRIPVQAALGEFYVTGCAGQGGQPGQWFVRWVIQEFFQGTLMSETFGFDVFDTARYFPPNVGMAGRVSGRCHGGRSWNWDRDGDGDHEGDDRRCRWCCRPSPCGCGQPGW